MGVKNLKSFSRKNHTRRISLCWIISCSTFGNITQLLSEKKNMRETGIESTIESEVLCCNEPSRSCTVQCIQFSFVCPQILPERTEIWSLNYDLANQDYHLEISTEKSRARSNLNLGIEVGDLGSGFLESPAKTWTPLDAKNPFTRRQQFWFWQIQNFSKSLPMPKHWRL